jgi:hypothetical protein
MLVLFRFEPSEGTLATGLMPYSQDVKEPNNVVAAVAVPPLIDGAIIVHYSNTLQIFGQLFSFF